MNPELIPFAILICVFIPIILVGDAWAFLTPDERGKVLWWMFVTKWVPLWIVESDAFAHLFATYVGRKYYPLEPDFLTELPLSMKSE